MAVLVDTSGLPATESADAIVAALSSTSVPITIDVAPGAHSIIEGWSLGAGVDLVNTVTTDTLHMRRTRRHLRIAAPERISLGYNTRGECACAATQLGPGVLREHEQVLMDLTSEYDTRWTGPNAAVGFLADYTELGLPVDLVRTAVPRLPASPLYDLTRQHLRDLPGIVRQTPPGPALGMLGAGMLDLVRAMVAATVPDSPQARTGRAESLHTVVLAYIEANLHDPALGPERIAREHGISKRQLYRLFAAEADTPAEAIIRRRLDGARRDLATRATHRTLVAAVARRWGFTDPRHFARRFKAAYGMSPGEWLRRHLREP
ncbi:helix-turn-helix domain-containing protein [Dactylosporangium sp. NPDC051541]|uniref:helix-turn-helix domain-containing protein n=1 Tax=Dactylosporangium sp. NPDC051541 TaxID=3363977 RepID=UPI0037ACB31A